MSPLDLVRDLGGVAGLGALLATAHRHPRRRVEASVSVVVAAGVLALGLLSPHQAWTATRPLWPVVGFLVAILVVSDVCARAGLFAAAAARVARYSRGDGRRLFVGVFGLAAVVTTVLSLDATVVLLTPVVVAAARGLRDSPRPGAYACLRIANSGSLLLPVSNLTNLLAMPYLGVTFGGFAARMALPLAVVLVVEFVGLRLLFRADLTPADRPQPDAAELPPTPLLPVVVVLAMLAGFGVLSPFGVAPFWVAAAAAVVLVGWARVRGLVAWRQVADATHASFALFVLALGAVVAGLSRAFLGDAVRHLLPASTSFLGLLALAGLATGLSALLANLSATLLLVPLAAPLGTDAVLAALVGLTAGAGLTWTGSLANLLWRRTLVADDIHPSTGSFHRVSLLLTPVSVIAAVAAIWLG